MRLKIGAVLFENYELLDFYGPLQMFGMLTEHFDIDQVAERAGPIISSAGIIGYAEHDFSAGKQYDIVLVPGGYGTRSQCHNAVLLQWLQAQYEGARYMTSVCTGSLLLSAAGLLNGKQATTNKAVFREISATNSAVDWIAMARWVESGKIVTSSGVSAGMDMALRLIALTVGIEKAEQVADEAEYVWHREASWDPFAEKYQLNR